MPASLAVEELWYGNKDGRFIGVGGGGDDAGGDGTESLLCFWKWGRRRINIVEGSAIEDAAVVFACQGGAHRLVVLVILGLWFCGCVFVLFVLVLRNTIDQQESGGFGCCLSLFVFTLLLVLLRCISAWCGHRCSTRNTLINSDSMFGNILNYDNDDAATDANRQSATASAVNNRTDPTLEDTNRAAL